MLYGADPLPSNGIRLAIDEETVAGDTTRRHTQEQVYYAVFRDDQTADLNAVKTQVVYAGSPVPYAIPGADVIYTLEVSSDGTAGIDTDTVFLVDELPSQISFYDGDIDDGGPETGSIAFDAGSSGLTFNPATDLRFSKSATRPTSFAACLDTPSSPYDPAIRYICFNPKGRLLAGSLLPDTDFAFSFRARIE